MSGWATALCAASWSGPPYAKQRRSSASAPQAAVSRQPDTPYAPSSREGTVSTSVSWWSTVFGRRTPENSKKTRRTRRDLTNPTNEPFSRVPGDSPRNRCNFRPCRRWFSWVPACSRCSQRNLHLKTPEFGDGREQSGLLTVEPPHRGQGPSGGDAV